jgi:hypothetical protein
MVIAFLVYNLKLFLGETDGFISSISSNYCHSISAINHCCCLGPKAQLNMHIENAYTITETNEKYYRIKLAYTKK